MHQSESQAQQFLGRLWFEAQIHLQSAAPCKLDKASAQLLIDDGRDASRTEIFELLGELGLDGEVRAVRGALPAAVAAHAAGRALLLPAANLDDLRFMPEMRAYGARSLREVCAHLAGTEKFRRRSSRDRHRLNLRRTSRCRRSKIFVGRPKVSVRSKLLRQVVTDFCSSGRRAVAKVCWRSACPVCYRRCVRMRHWKSR